MIKAANARHLQVQLALIPPISPTFALGEWMGHTLPRHPCFAVASRHHMCAIGSSWGLIHRCQYPLVYLQQGSGWLPRPSALHTKHPSCHAYKRLDLVRPWVPYGIDRQQNLANSALISRYQLSTDGHNKQPRLLAPLFRQAPILDSIDTT